MQTYNITIDETQRALLERGLTRLRLTDGEQMEPGAFDELSDLAAMLEQLPKVQAQHEFATQRSPTPLTHDFTL